MHVQFLSNGSDINSVSNAEDVATHVRLWSDDGEHVATLMHDGSQWEATYLDASTYGTELVSTTYDTVAGFTATLASLELAYA